VLLHCSTAVLHVLILLQKRTQNWDFKPYLFFLRNDSDKPDEQPPALLHHVVDVSTVVLELFFLFDIHIIICRLSYSRFFTWKWIHKEMKGQLFVLSTICSIYNLIKHKALGGYYQLISTSINFCISDSFVYTYTVVFNDKTMVSISGNLPFRIICYSNILLWN
jgi:hypothetical protein